MTTKQFKALVHAINVQWQDKKGVIVMLDDTDTRLTVPDSDINLMPEDCFLWKDNECLYRGKLNDIQLQKLLTSLKVKTYGFTNIGRLDRTTRMFPVSGLGNDA